MPSVTRLAAVRLASAIVVQSMGFERPSPATMRPGGVPPDIAETLKCDSPHGFRA